MGHDRMQNDPVHDDREIYRRELERASDAARKRGWRATAARPAGKRPSQQDEDGSRDLTRDMDRVRQLGLRDRDFER